MIPKEDIPLISKLTVQFRDRRLSDSETMLVLEAAKIGLSLAQQSIQDEAIRFAQWMDNSNPDDIIGKEWEHLYTKFKTEQDEQK